MDSKWPSGGSSAANHRKEDSRLKVGVKSRSASSVPLRPKKHLAWYVPYNANPLEKKLSGVPQIKWKCPPKLNLDPLWHVACGEESSEVRAQKYREATVIEAVYPHPSAIPPGPLISPDMGGKHDDERQIPLIPIVPIEEAGGIEMPFSTSAPVKTFNCHSTAECNSSVSPNPPTGEKSLLDMLHGLEGRDLAIVAGAAVAVAAAVQNEHEIDTELLIKCLTNPEMMKALVNKSEIGVNSEQRFPSGPKSSTCPLSSHPGIDSFVPVSMNQPILFQESASDLGVSPSKSLSIPLDESAGDLSAPPAKRARICSPNLVNNWSPAQLRSNSHPLLIQDSTNGAREPEIALSRIHGAMGTNEPRPPTIPTPIYHENQDAGMVNHYGVPNAAPMLPLYPSFSKPNSEAATQPMHPPPFFSGLRPVSTPPPFSSTPRPIMHCVTDRALDHAGLKPCLGPNPPAPFALGVNFPSSSTFRPHPHPHPHTHPYMNKFPPPVGDFTYCKSLIKQHGVHHVNN